MGGGEKGNKSEYRSVWGGGRGGERGTKVNIEVWGGKRGGGREKGNKSEHRSVVGGGRGEEKMNIEVWGE